MKTEIKNLLQKAWSFILRHSLWVIVGLIGLYIYFPDKEFIQTIALCMQAEAIALFLSGVASYVYTKVDFTKSIIYGVDSKLNSTEQHAFMNTLGYIFLGVHLLVGLCILGIYIVAFKP